MYHYRKTHKIYSGYPKPESCDFCQFERTQAETNTVFQHCVVLPNRTFYDVWELRDVVDHLLVVPKAHVESLAQLAPAARHEIIDVIANYEAQGYNVYSRAPGSPQKSVLHQHTHLIKIGDRAARASLYVRRPYWLIKW
jgi:ATP adenylyltransferase